MTADLKPYPSYKDSGIAWLGGLPAHWSIKPLKHWVKMNVAVLAELKEPDYRFKYIDIGAVSSGVLVEKPKQMVFSDAPSRARRIVRAGDTIISTVRTYLKAVWFMDKCVDDLVCSTGFAVLTPDNSTQPKFVSYLVQSDTFTNRVTANSVGTAYPAINESRLGSFHAGIPPKEEQAAIVRYLDHVDRDIRKYIRAKQKLIKLLEEQKQAIIHRAVTRGLDPNVPLKPSGVEWLGDVPAHWELTQLKRFWSVTDCKHLTVPFTDEGFPLASVREVQSFDLNLLTAKRTSEEWYSNLIEGDRKPKFGDLIYCRNVSVGACAYVDSNIDFAMGQDVCLIRSKTQNSRYLNYLLCSNFMKSQLSQILVGSTFNRINVVDIKALQILIPPVEEQNLISTLLDSHVKQYEQPITLIKKEIQTLIEYCTRLIADVVTGKVDVREIASKLPEMDESDILEEAVLDDEVVDTDEADLSEEDADADE